MSSDLYYRRREMTTGTERNRKRKKAGNCCTGLKLELRTTTGVVEDPDFPDSEVLPARFLTPESCFGLACILLISQGYPTELILTHLLVDLYSLHDAIETRWPTLQAMQLPTSRFECSIRATLQRLLREICPYEGDQTHGRLSDSSFATRATTEVIATDFTRCLFSHSPLYSRQASPSADESYRKDGFYFACSACSWPFGSQ